MGNAAFLIADGRTEAEIADYLSRWALLNEAECSPALNSLKAPGMVLYVLGYYQGWRLVGSFLDSPDHHHRVRRQVTEHS